MHLSGNRWGDLRVHKHGKAVVQQPQQPSTRTLLLHWEMGRRNRSYTIKSSDSLDGITRGISVSPSCANLYLSLSPSSSVVPPPPRFKRTSNPLGYIAIVFPLPALFFPQSSQPLSALSVIQLAFTQSCMTSYQQNQKQWGSCHAFH